MGSPQPSEPDRSIARRLGYWVLSMGGTLLTLAVVAFLLLASLYLYSQKASSELEQKKGVGAKLPALELQPLTGNSAPVTLADLEGKVVLFDFWGTWCPPCREEIPHMAHLTRELAEETDFRLLAVSCGSGGREDVEDLRTETESFLTQEKLELPTYTDPNGTTRRAFGEVATFNAYPTVFLLDRQGVIRAVWQGYKPGLIVAIRERIYQLLNASPSEPQ
jgi:cytochrome c biogenesis protein CcmG, thiol:disulfide interchange protein DsbE